MFKEILAKHLSLSYTLFMNNTYKKSIELAELHFHLGQSVDPHILWSIAHEQGIKLPSKDYWEFYKLITLEKESVTWEDYHALFKWTELIQSSPVAIERAVYEVISGAYRANNITLLEPSFNPMFRNRGGERDLDQIILAALRGMERALVEFPSIRAGLILMLDRRLSLEQNAIIVEKAIKYKTRGIVGIDMGGPDVSGKFSYDDYIDLYSEAKKAGLKTTVHIGEDGTVEEMEHVLEILSLDRINHGFRAYTSPRVMEVLAKKNLTLCLCPTSSLRLNFIKDAAHLKEILHTLLKNKVKFCINTDNPSMLKINLTKQFDFIRANGILSEEEIAQVIKWGFEATFIPNEVGKNLYL
jgi:adenosine deaminase